CQQFNSAPPTF
nr:immunoglobulin light chain junction region [Macaca mulatta]MPN91681.1 immunoglobulin light chain junction region [Macaca mulatta]MPN92174.1 immunoglobulin light chain junction region [Macaca mulatta]MPN93069.1 immunoglobulin light chain junction region [Macaca mulatta]MPN95038.1 immunoglobulin light chain junction region [Macaca mulatta]